MPIDTRGPLMSINAVNFHFYCSFHHVLFSVNFSRPTLYVMQGEYLVSSKERKTNKYRGIGIEKTFYIGTRKKQIVGNLKFENLYGISEQPFPDLTPCLTHPYSLFLWCQCSFWGLMLKLGRFYT